MFEKKFAKKVQKYYKLSEGGEGGRGWVGWGGWRIVIPMPEAINFVDAAGKNSTISHLIIQTPCKVVIYDQFRASYWWIE
jgi:hypothetical protein